MDVDDNVGREIQALLAFDDQGVIMAQPKHAAGRRVRKRPVADARALLPAPVVPRGTPLELETLPVAKFRDCLVKSPSLDDAEAWPLLQIVRDQFSKIYSGTHVLPTSTSQGSQDNLRGHVLEGDFNWHILPKSATAFQTGCNRQFIRPYLLTVAPYLMNFDVLLRRAIEAFACNFEPRDCLDATDSVQADETPMPMVRAESALLVKAMVQDAPSIRLASSTFEGSIAVQMLPSRSVSRRTPSKVVQAHTTWGILLRTGRDQFLAFVGSVTNCPQLVDRTSGETHVECELRWRTVGVLLDRFQSKARKGAWGGLCRNFWPLCF